MALDTSYLRELQEWRQLEDDYLYLVSIMKPLYLEKAANAADLTAKWLEFDELAELIVGHKHSNETSEYLLYRKTLNKLQK